jgi:hypothetical protein
LTAEFPLKTQARASAFRLRTPPPKRAAVLFVKVQLLTRTENSSMTVFGLPYRSLIVLM